MDSFNFLRDLSRLTTGDGFRYDRPFSLGDFFVSSTGVVVGAASTVTPGFALAETNAQVIQWPAASASVAGGLNVLIPGDYDESQDELRLFLNISSPGTTNAPTMTATAYQKRLLTALAQLSSAVATLPSGGTTSTTFLPGLYVEATDRNYGLDTLTLPAAANAIPKLVAGNNYMYFDFSGLKLRGGDVLTINLAPTASHTTDAINIYAAFMRYKSDLALFRSGAR